MVNISIGGTRPVAIIFDGTAPLETISAAMTTCQLCPYDAKVEEDTSLELRELERQRREKERKRWKEIQREHDRR